MIVEFKLAVFQYTVEGDLLFYSLNFVTRVVHELVITCPRFYAFYFFFGNLSWLWKVLTRQLLNEGFLIKFCLYDSELATPFLLYLF